MAGPAAAVWPHLTAPRTTTVRRYRVPVPDRPVTDDRPPLPPVAWRPALLAAGTLLAVLLATSARYGPHRDELYFLAAGNRLDWGYADQPPLTPLIARLADAVAPGSLVALHVPAALMMTGLVVLSALLARELGGGRAAQVLTVLTVGTGAAVVGLGHWLSTATADTLAWVAVTLLAARALRRDDARWWVVAGGVAGVGLLNKHLVAFLVAALAVGVLLSPAVRHHARSAWTWAGVLLAAALWAPNLVWQARHGWPQLELAADIRDEFLTLGERAGFVVLLLVIISPVATVLWVRGWRRLARAPELAWARPFAWAFAILTVGFFVTGGKAYYLVGLLPVLVAAGAVDAVRAWEPARVRRGRWVLAGAGIVSWPLVLPVLPAAVYAASPLPAVDDLQAETLGWPELVGTVNRAVDDAGAQLVVTANYGEAGALEWYGTPVPVFSGHNGYGEWGPPDDALTGPFVLVGYGESPDWAAGCRTVARIDNGLGLANEEQAGPVRVCTGTTAPWSVVWERVEHLSA